MYYELYLDVLFLENLLLDYLLLGLLSAILKCRSPRLRRLAAAALGGAGVCLLYALSLNGTVLGAVLLYGVLGTLMVRLGLSVHGKRPFLYAVALLYVCSLLLGGIFQWMEARIRLPVYPFLFFSLAGYAVLTLCMRGLLSFRQRRQVLYRAVLLWRGRSWELTGLLDTGNQLFDPLLGRPVSLLSKELAEELKKEGAPAFHPIPYHSVGKKHGLLPVFAAEGLQIYLPDGEELWVERPLFGVPEEPLSSEKEYQLILHPELVG